jgi:hypothetical protein
MSHMKKCRKCEAEKSPTDFYADKRTPDGLKLWCKDCWNAYQRERWADGRINREKKAAANVAWRAANPDSIRAINRRSNLKRKFGITPEAYDAMHAAQDGRCAACGSTDSGDRRFETFSVDHDHATGKVRALLCSPCNRALGHVGDDPDRLMSLVAYLLRFQDVLTEMDA